MKQKRITGWVLVIVGILFYLFFKKYHGDFIPFPFVFYAIGFSMTIYGLIILSRTPKLKHIKLIEMAEELIKQIKENGDRVEVDLNDCEIKEHHYFDKIDYTKSYNDFEILNFYEYAMYNENYRDSKNDNVIKQSVVIKKIQINGQEKTIQSPVLPYDRIKLLLSFNKKKTTNVYFDKINPEVYYFDLEFVRN